MRISFLLQRRFARVGHAMITHLAEEFGPDTHFSAYIEPRYNKYFLEKQKDITYEELLLDEDLVASADKEIIDWNFLREAEAKYGIPTLWPYLYIDRVLMQSQLIREYPNNVPLFPPEHLLRVLQAGIKRVEEFLNSAKPDVIVTSVVASLGTMLLWQIAKHRGIKTLLLSGTRIKNGIIFSEDYKNFTWADKIFTELQNGKKDSDKKTEAIKFIEEFRNKPTPYLPEFSPEFQKGMDRIGQITFLKPTNIFSSIYWYTKRSLSYIFNKHRDYSDENPFYLIWDKTMRKIRGLRGFADFWEMPPIESESFSFYPLHYEPEMALLLYAPHYTDQLHLIKQIARSIPIDQKLYIKEHPQMVGYRTRSYYAELRKIPNVRLIHPRVSGTSLTQKAKIIFAITGTAAWEGLLLGKPIITFGDVYFNTLSGAKRCRSYEDLSSIVHEQLKSHKHNEDELIDFVSALLEDSIQANVAYLWSRPYSLDEIKEDAGLRSVSKLLAKKIKEIVPRS